MEGTNSSLYSMAGRMLITVIPLNQCRIYESRSCIDTLRYKYYGGLLWSIKVVCSELVLLFYISFCAVVPQICLCICLVCTRIILIGLQRFCFWHIGSNTCLSTNVGKRLSNQKLAFLCFTTKACISIGSTPSVAKCKAYIDCPNPCFGPTINPIKHVLCYINFTSGLTLFYCQKIPNLVSLPNWHYFVQ